MRAKRPEESWAEYAKDTEQDADPIKYPSKDPNRSGPGPGDHVSVEEPTPQHNRDKKVINPPVQEPPAQKEKT
jgi:hypothetical protein